MLIVEDGSIVANANTYITLEEADSFLVSRGLWDTTPTEAPEETITKKEQSIIRACDYLNTLSWKGALVDENQELSLPRIYNGKVQEIYAIPKAVKKAQIELARIFFDGVDLLAPVREGVKSISETVDVISTSTTYSDNAPSVYYYKGVMDLLRPYLLHVEGEEQTTKIYKVVH